MRVWVLIMTLGENPKECNTSFLYKKLEKIEDFDEKQSVKAGVINLQSNIQ